MKSIIVLHQYSSKGGKIDEGVGVIEAGKVKLFVVRAGVAAAVAVSGAHLTT